MDEYYEEDSTHVPELWLHAIRQILVTDHNHSIDITEPHIRHSFVGNYVFFIICYAMLILAGTALNVCVVTHIIRKRLYYDATYCFIINLALSNLVMCLVVLPLTLTVLIVENWIFGQFLCFFTPMIQVNKISVITDTCLV